MIRVFPTTDALMHAVAALFCDQAESAIGQRNRFSVALSGGSTPKAAYELLANPPYCDRVDWPHVHVFWGDERCVPPDDTRSNYRMAREALLDHVPIPGDNIHRVLGESSPADAARAYASELSEFFGNDSAGFDLVLLGLGTDGHTASLFPRTGVVHERERRAAEVYEEHSELWRVTLTLPVLAAARCIAFVVSGADKAVVLAEVLLGAEDPSRLPAQLIRKCAAARWLVDLDAAARLPDSTTQ